MLKNILKLILIVGLFAAGYHFRFEIREKLDPYVEQVRSALHLSYAVNPCVEPIPYSLGGFDKRFNISQEYFLSALLDAEAIWEKVYDKQLFVYAPDAAHPMKVNLVYDYRQQATSKLSSLGIVVKNNRASYDMLKVKFDALEKKYEQDKANFNARVEALNQKQKAYEDQVDYWNAKGGAPKDEYDKLQATRAALEAESNKIQTAQTTLNNEADELNALVAVLNRLVGVLNLSVEKYNTTNDTRGESFEEGVYTTDGTESEIDIYEFSNRDKLVRVLAHELGHALGLDHVDDKNAIMYKLNQGNALKLSDADIKAFDAKCGTK